MTAPDDMKRDHRMTAGTLRRWACPGVSVALAILTLAVLDWSLWKVLLLAILLACPVVAVWAVIQGNKPLPVPIGPVPDTTGSTLDWLAPYYDAVSRMVGINNSFRSSIITVAALRPREKVLDVGCGTGVLTRMAADAVGPQGEARGIDAAADMIRIARQEGQTVRSAAKFDLAAIESLPFPDDTFDVAFLSFVVHCLPSDLKQAGLKETWRALKPGGRVIMVDLDRPRHPILRALVRPFQSSEFFGDHLKGLVPILLRDAGFAPVAEVGCWRGIFGIWVGRKPKGRMS